MNSLYAGVHIPNKPSEVELNNLDFTQSVSYLRKQIAEKLQLKPEEVELVYNGLPLDDEMQLDGTVKPNGFVHCFKKTKQYVPFKPSEDVNTAEKISKVQVLFNVISHIQIQVCSRVSILQKVLAEYPEFRRNLGAQALVRDSVLFNTLHNPEVVQAIAEHYPLICEATPFIVDTIKKELLRDSSSTFAEPATDSTNSSEEENSLGASSSSSDHRSAMTPAVGENQSENARIRMISRQQLQAALAQIGLGSVNSLSNIAQRNNDGSTSNSTASSSSLNTNPSATSLPSSASGERITSEMFRNHLERALNSMRAPTTAQRMDTNVLEDAQMSTTDGSVNTAADGDIPQAYRNHQYAEQLRTMAQMGFLNYDENLSYLNITNGNIENAVNLLMGTMN